MKIRVDVKKDSEGKIERMGPFIKVKIDGIVSGIMLDRPLLSEGDGESIEYYCEGNFTFRNIQFHKNIKWTYTPDDPDSFQLLSGEDERLSTRAIFFTDSSNEEIENLNKSIIEIKDWCDLHATAGNLVSCYKFLFSFGEYPTNPNTKIPHFMIDAPIETSRGQYDSVLPNFRFYVPTIYTSNTIIWVAGNGYIPSETQKDNTRIGGADNYVQFKYSDNDGMWIQIKTPPKE